MERAQQARSPWGRWRARRAHLTRVGGRRQGFTPLSPLFSLLLLTLLAASAGCGMPMMPADIPVGFHSSGIFPLFLFAAAVFFILLAAGVDIKILKFRFRPPADWAGRIFLAVLGVSMSLLSVWLWGYMFAPRPLDLGELVELPSVEGRRFVLTKELSGEVSFRENEKFEEEYSDLTIRAVAEDAFEVEADLDLDGRFAMDIPVDTQTPVTVTVTWRARKPGDYVLWPMEINVPASPDEGPTDISFSFLKVDDVFVGQKEEAIRAVRACEFERADGVLPSLLAVLKPYEDTGLRAQDWPHEIHVELANEAAKLRSCTQDAWMFERKWRRGAIERATTWERRIYAMNAWAGYSREVYRPDGRAWPDLTPSDVGLAREEYRNFLRSDLQLVRTQFAARRALVLNAMDPPTIAGCLNDGQWDALRLLVSTLSTGLEKVNLNRMMNAISGLQRIFLIGTWIDYPAPGMGQIEIAREPEGAGYRYRFRPRDSNGEPGEPGSGELTFAPERFAPCRFETVVDTPESRFVYVILEGPGQDGHLRMEPSGRVFRPAG